MALQPSTQSCRVIWLRAGIALQLGEREGRRRLDQPVDPQPPVGEAGRRVPPPLRRARLGVAVGAELRRHLGRVELAGERLRRRSAGAPGTTAIRRSRARSSRKLGLAPSQSQPPRSSAGAARPAVSSRRRVIGLIARSSFGKPVAAGDHRADLVQRPGEDHHDQVHDDEQHQEPGGDEVDRARRLPPAEQVEQPRPGRVHRRRHGQPGQHHHRDQHEEHADDRRASAARCSAAPPRPSGTAGSRDARCPARGSRGRSSRARGSRSRHRCPLTRLSDEVAGDAERRTPRRRSGASAATAPGRSWTGSSPSRETPGADAGRRRARPSTPVVSSATSPTRR